MKKHAQETNWKQKFQKPQNENICLTNLNMENKGNFPILAFGDYIVNVEWCHQIESTPNCSYMNDKGENKSKSGCFIWHFTIISKKL